MARLVDQELYCRVCGKTRDKPDCCGTAMDHDNGVFFCSVCPREVKTPICCKQRMEIRNRVRDIKGEIFGRS